MPRSSWTASPATVCAILFARSWRAPAGRAGRGRPHPNAIAYRHWREEACSMRFVTLPWPGWCGGARRPLCRRHRRHRCAGWACPATPDRGHPAIDPRRGAGLALALSAIPAVPLDAAAAEPHSLPGTGRCLPGHQLHGPLRTRRKSIPPTPLPPSIRTPSTFQAGHPCRAGRRLHRGPTDLVKTLDYECEAGWPWCWAGMPKTCPPGRPGTMCSATPS